MAFISATVSVGAVTRQSDYQRVMDNTVFNKQQLAITNDLTSDNITHTLPAVTGLPQTESIYWTNGGTYKLTLAVSDSETVGGISAGTWLGEGEGHMVVESDGTNWQVREYKDYGNHATNGAWYKYISGEMKCYIDDISVTTDISAGSGVARATTGTLWTFPKTFVSTPVASGGTSSANSAEFVYTYNVGTVNVRVNIAQLGGSFITRTTCHISAIGRWRT